MRPLPKILWTGLSLIVIFSVTFFFFYKRAQTNALPPEPLILTPAVIGRQLPEANLVNVSNEKLDDERLRRGKVILTFTLTTCQICGPENEYLKTVADSHKEIKFFNVIPFGDKDEVLKTAQKNYTFETYYDDGSMLSRSLEIYKVPLLIYLEDGIIKKTWIEGATVDEPAQAKFKDWLNN
jgi:hypothetical protein